MPAVALPHALCSRKVLTVDFFAKSTVTTFQERERGDVRYLFAFLTTLDFSWMRPKPGTFASMS